MVIFRISPIDSSISIWICGLILMQRLKNVTDGAELLTYCLSLALTVFSPNSIHFCAVCRTAVTQIWRHRCVCGLHLVFVYLELSSCWMQNMDCCIAIKYSCLRWIFRRWFCFHFVWSDSNKSGKHFQRNKCFVSYKVYSKLYSISYALKARNPFSSMKNSVYSHSHWKTYGLMHVHVHM